jgi:hypothetical protein
MIRPDNFGINKSDRSRENDVAFSSVRNGLILGLIAATRPPNLGLIRFDMRYSNVRLSPAESVPITDFASEPLKT